MIVAMKDIYTTKKRSNVNIAGRKKGHLAGKLTLSLRSLLKLIHDLRKAIRQPKMILSFFINYGNQSHIFVKIVAKI